MLLWIGEGRAGANVATDASMGGIYFFISKRADHGDINPAEFGFYFEDKVDKDWQQLEFGPKGEVNKNGWFHIAATWEFTTKGKSSQEAYLYFSGEEIAKGNGLGEFPVLHVKPRFGLEIIKYVPSKNGAQGLIDNISIYSKALTKKRSNVIWVSRCQWILKRNWH